MSELLVGDDCAKVKRVGISPVAELKASAVLVQASMNSTAAKGPLARMAAAEGSTSRAGRMMGPDVIRNRAFEVQDLSSVRSARIDQATQRSNQKIEVSARRMQT